MTLLDKAKKALRLTTSAYDDELTDLIQAAQLDLGVAGVVLPAELDTLCQRAILTYVKTNFGKPVAEEYDRLKASYDEQKAQLQTATGYTDWGDSE